jgi:hypothetical protein
MAKAQIYSQTRTHSQEPINTVNQMGLANTNGKILAFMSESSKMA